MSQLINPHGPEANNARAAEFEDAVVDWAATLGWETVVRNVDLFHTHGEQSKGVDVLWTMLDPQEGERIGLIGEAKIRHPLKPSGVHAEVATLAKKVAALGSTVPKLAIEQDIDITREGVLVYDAKPFDPDRFSEMLGTVPQQGRTRAEWPRTIHTLGPDTLLGMADAFGLAPPTRFYWPPFALRAGKWAPSAPPFQVTYGMLAYKSQRKNVLWLRDPLEQDDDLRSLSEIVWEWGINIDQVICSGLERDDWRALGVTWEQQVKKARERGTGRLPATVEPRGLSFGSMTPFFDEWGRT